MPSSEENGDGAIHVRPIKAPKHLVTTERTVRSSACLFHSPVVKVPPDGPVLSIRRRCFASLDVTEAVKPADSYNWRTRQVRSAQRGTYHRALSSVNGFWAGDWRDRPCLHCAFWRNARAARWLVNLRAADGIRDISLFGGAGDPNAELIPTRFGVDPVATLDSMAATMQQSYDGASALGGGNVCAR